MSEKAQFAPWAAYVKAALWRRWSSPCDPEPEVRETTVAALREIGDLQAVDAMVAALEDPHAGVRWHAAKTLERFGWQPRNDQQRLLRDVALGHFAAAAQAGLPALDHLMGALNDPRPENRRS